MQTSSHRGSIAQILSSTLQSLDMADETTYGSAEDSFVSGKGKRRSMGGRPPRRSDEDGTLPVDDMEGGLQGGQEAALRSDGEDEGGEGSAERRASQAQDALPPVSGDERCAGRSRAGG
jgi:hypothetical protein